MALRGRERQKRRAIVELPVARGPLRAAAPHCDKAISRSATAARITSAVTKIVECNRMVAHTDIAERRALAHRALLIGSGGGQIDRGHICPLIGRFCVYLDVNAIGALLYGSQKYEQARPI